MSGCYRCGAYKSTGYECGALCRRCIERKFVQRNERRRIANLANLADSGRAIMAAVRIRMTDDR